MADLKFTKRTTAPSAPAAGRMQMYFDGNGVPYSIDSDGNTSKIKTDTLADITDAGSLASQNADAVALTGGSAALTGPLTTSAGGIGYATGAGGTVTQVSSKSNGVTLNKLTGQITTASSSLAANTTVSFTLTNSEVVSTDQIVATHHSGGTAGAYAVIARATGAGTASISIRNVTSGSLSQTLVIKFSIQRAPTS